MIRKSLKESKPAAKRIQKKCDVFIAIGIGGSYLGARAAIELLKSPFYNNLKKDTPDIYFVGNNITVEALRSPEQQPSLHLLSRIFKELLERNTARKRQEQEFLPQQIRQEEP